MKKKAKERKSKKDDPIEKELRRKLSLLSNSNTQLPTAPTPPSAPPASNENVEDTYVVSFFSFLFSLSFLLLFFFYFLPSFLRVFPTLDT